MLSIHLSTENEKNLATLITFGSLFNFSDIKFVEFIIYENTNGLNFKN
jgi:hypothetical protein